MKSITQGHMRAGWETVRGTKMRNFWTMLGVIIGVASVITIVGIGEGAKQQISGEIHHLGKNLITVRPGQLKPGSAAGDSTTSALSGLDINGFLTAKDVGIIASTKGVAATAPMAVVTGAVRGDNGYYSDGFVIGTTADFSSLLNQTTSDGVFLTNDDVGSDVAVLGKHAAEVMFNVDVPLGRSFRFHGKDFIVRGIFNDFNTTPLSQEANFNNAIFIPYDVAQDLSKQTAPTFEILAKPDSTQNVNQTIDLIQHNLDRAHGGQSNLSVLAGNQNLATSDYILSLLTRLIAGVASISLIVGGVGIMNVMLVSVAERTHEIGIRKAIGATNRQILSQFMIEATVLSLVGGIIGILVAFLIDIVLRITTNLHPVISWQVVVLATGISLLVGIIFGTVPAIKAARRDPIDSLRVE